MARMISGGGMMAGMIIGMWCKRQRWRGNGYSSKGAKG